MSKNLIAYADKIGNNCLLLEAHRAGSSEVTENEEHLLCAVRKVEIKLTAEKRQEEGKVKAVKFSYSLQLSCGIS